MSIAEAFRQEAYTQTKDWTRDYADFEVQPVKEGGVHVKYMMSWHFSRTSMLSYVEIMSMGSYFYGHFIFEHVILAVYTMFAYISL